MFGKGMGSSSGGVSFLSTSPFFDIFSVEILVFQGLSLEVNSNQAA